MSERSLCCNSKVKVVGKTTLYYICLKCKAACNVYYKERNTWERNPKTQVQNDKRRKIKDKEIKKEIREARE